MTQENKQLLLKDLCARLPYGVMVKHELRKEPNRLDSIDIYRETVEIANMGCYEIYKVEFVKPYLRPMLSMTDEEDKEWRSKMRKEYYEAYPNAAIDTGYYEYYATQDSFDYLYEHHFDNRCLIEKGLALEAPKGMYKTEAL